MARRYVIFSWQRDKDCLRECVKSVRRVDKEAKITLVDEEKAPCGAFDFVDEYVTSDFNRGGNLNGPECVLGILNELARHSEEEVFKLDSDIILTKRPIFLNKSTFFEAYFPLLGSGVCYGMTPSTAKAAAEYFKKYPPTTGNPYQEDLTISTLCLHLGDCNIIPHNNGEWVLGYNLTRNWPAFYNAGIIHFGNFASKLEANLHRDLIAAHMKMFNDWIEKTEAQADNTQ